MMEFSRHEDIIARKSHVCSFCGREIKVGEKYGHFLGKYDGDFFDFHYHPMCEVIIGEYCKYIGDQEYDIYCAHEWLEETVCGNCKRYRYNDDNNESDYCNISVFDCPKTIDMFGTQDVKE